MDRTQKIKSDLEAYRASKQATSPVAPTSSTGNIKADLEAYRASKKAVIQPTISEQPKGETGLKGFSIGFGKGLLGTFKGMSQFGENLGQGILSKIEKTTGLPVTQPKVYSEEALQKSAEQGGFGKLLTDENLKAKGGAEKFGKVSETIAEIALPTPAIGKATKLNKIPSLISKARTEKELTSLAQKLSPKLTAREVRLAEQQGRIISGRKPTFFRGGTESTVLPTEKVLNATKTVKKYIPNANKLDDPKLYKEIESKATNIAKKLQPKMKKVSIENDTVQSITDNWKLLKQKQLKDPYISEGLNLKNIQKDFEKRLLDSKSKNLNDLWETAKKYDKSVPDNIKNANSLSPESLQNKKAIWLQNRDILKKAINDKANGLGKTSEKAFKEMSDLYSSNQNILTKATIEKSTESGLSKALNTKLGKVVKTAGLGAAGLGVLGGL